MYKNFSNYEIFADGRIWSKYSKKFLKPKTMKNGYQRVCLVDNEGKHHQELVHRVTWMAVNGVWEIPKGFDVHHCNEVKTDNQISNLLLCSHKENCNFGTRNEKVAKALSKRVGAFKNNELIMVFASTQDAQRNGYHSGHVSDCCRNCYIREGNNKYKGYVWKYLEDDE